MFEYEDIVILYFIGSGHEKSGVFTLGFQLLNSLDNEVALVLFDSITKDSSLANVTALPIEVSHCPTAVVAIILKSRTRWPSSLHILPNNTACGYEVAFQLRKILSLMGVKVTVVAIAHSNTTQSLDLVVKNASLVDKIFGVSTAILRSFRSDLRAQIGTTGSLAYPMPAPSLIVARRGELISAGPLKLIYVGRLVEDQKRVSRLAQLVGILRARMVPFVLQVIGDGYLADEIARVAASNPSGGTDVLMSGELSHEQVLEAMSTADVLVLTSEFEGSPLVVMEAMSVGAVPVVMNYGLEVAELITHGKNGYVAEQGRVDEMADMLGLLARDRKKLRELSDNALLRASEFVSFNTWIDEICRPTPKPLIRNDHQNSSYVETWERIKWGVRKIHADDKVLIWGGGHIGRLIVDELISNNHQVDGCVVVDRVLHKYLPRYRDVPYYSSDELPEEKFDVAIVASEYYAAEILAALEDLKRKRNPSLHITAVRDWR